MKNMKHMKTSQSSAGSQALGLSVAAVSAAAGLAFQALLLFSVIPAAAADDVFLKPDVPKMDTPVEAPSRTLKGTVQHSHKNGEQTRKPLSSGTNRTGSALGLPGLGRFGARSPMKAQTRNNTLDASALAGIGIIGVKFEMAMGRPPTIKLVFTGTPASDQGIQVDDVIVAVDGIPTYGLTKEEVYDLIVGTPHTSVTLSLQRGGDFSVKRLTRMDFNEITDPKVKADYLRNM